MSDVDLDRIPETEIPQESDTFDHPDSADTLTERYRPPRHPELEVQRS